MYYDINNYIYTIILYTMTGN